MLPSLVALAISAAPALACPGSETAMASVAKAEVDPTGCAKSAALVGENCSWSTGAMAQRVHAEGKDLALTTKLAPQGAKLASQVAAPYKAGEMYVIANQVIEQADASATLALTGKVLDVDGVKYYLVTSFQKSNS